MKKHVKLIVIMTVGPLDEARYRFDDLIDTINSITFYTTPERQIIIQDNSQQNIGSILEEYFPELIVIRSPQNYGISGGLYKSESVALLFAHAMYTSQVIIRMDMDALLTGWGLEDDAFAYFRQHPNVGLIGNYRVGCHNEPADFSWPRQELLDEISFKGWLRDRQRCLFMRDLFKQATECGYEPGEHVMGGVAIFSPVLLDRLVRANLLMREELRRSVLQEDHLFGLLTKAVGMDLGDFSGPNDPMAVQWRGMPHSPQEVMAGNKKIVHSTRFWHGMSEEAIRASFRMYRCEEPVR